MKRPASKGKADSNQRAIVQALEALGLPVMDLSGVGGGCEDLLVGVRWGSVHAWIPVEVKVPVSKSGRVRYTVDQQRWRDATRHYPRMTVTSAQDAVDQLRRLMAVHPSREVPA